MKIPPILERNSFALSFLIRKDKINKEGNVPLYMRITIDKAKAEYATGERLSLSIWNEGKIKGNSGTAKRIKDTMDTLRGRVMDIKNNYRDSETPLTARLIVDILNGKLVVKSKSLLEVFKLHNGMVYNLIGIDYAKATYSRYQTTMNHVAEYIKTKYKKNDISLPDLNYDFIRGLEIYFKKDRACNHNTTMKYIKNLKVITHYALKNEWMAVDPFINFECKIEKVERPFLSEEELQLLINKEFAIDRLDLVRDMFLFACYTGLAYVDVAKLSVDNLRQGVDGNLWIYLHRTKTNVKSTIPLSPIPLSILKKYKEYPQVEDKGVLLPILSNQKMNAYLKEVADLCGITKHLTFHVARHTFATTVTLEKGVSLESVANMLGHSSTRTTEDYSKVTEVKIANETKDIFY